jgi:DNA-binding NtrC family response regulator
MLEDYGEWRSGSSTIEQDSVAASGWVSVERLLADARRWDGAVWKSGALDRTMARVRRLGPQRTVLVRGASGTGKSIIVRMLHQLSCARNEPCVVVDCSTIDRAHGYDLLFGEPGGNTARSAYFTLAAGGSLVLDHVSELPMDVQRRLARLIRGLEERGGSTRPMVLAVSNRDPGAMMGREKFSAELYAMLSPNEVVMPLLSARREDIAPLAAHFVSLYGLRYGRSIRVISERALDALVRYQWPGNVRELGNAIERAVLLTREERLDLEDLDIDWGDTHCACGKSIPRPRAAARGRALEHAIREVLMRSLRQASGDLAQSAEMLGVSRPALSRLIGRYGIRQQDWQAA